MVQTVSTMVSLLLGVGGLGVIVLALAEDWQALRLALAPAPAMVFPPLPPRTHRIAGPQAARMIRIRSDWSPLRAAA